MNVKDTNSVQTPKPWPWRKRIMTAGVYSLLILIAAWVIGSSWYYLGRVTGLFKAFNLKKAVTSEIVGNPQLVDRFYAALDERVCTNPYLGFEITSETPLTFTPAEGRAACTELTLSTPQGHTAYVKIQGHPYPATKTLKTTVTGWQAVQTDTFPHPYYTATRVRALQTDIPVTAIIMESNPHISWSVIYYPADPVGEQRVEKLSRSLRVVPITAE